MKIKKITAIILAAFMLITLFGCKEKNVVSVNSDEQPTDNTTQSAKITFLAKSGPQDKTLMAATGDVYDWNDFDDDVMINDRPLVKIDEFKDKQVKYKLNGVECTFTYLDSTLYPDGSEEHWYRATDELVKFNKNNEFCGFLCLNEGFVYKYKATTKEQREELARQIVQEFLNVDVSEWSYRERGATEDIYGYIDYYSDGKKTIERFVVTFENDGKLKACMLNDTGEIKNISDYPNFDRDECYKVAEAKLMEKLESYNRPVSYGNVEEHERYWKIGDKMYYKFRFGIDGSTVEGTEHELITDQEALNNRLDSVVDIYVELITE